MKIEQAQFIQTLMEDAGEECEIREEYSGRGMYGKTTAGVIIDSELLLIQVLLSALEETVPEVPEFGSLRHDNMGNQTIVY